MEKIIFWLAVWVGIMFIAFALMTFARMLAALRGRRRRDRVYDRSLVPILRFNLRKHYIEQIKVNAENSLESMTPGGMAYKLRETLVNHDVMIAKAAAQALEHIGTSSASRRPARKSSAGFRI